ncbi:MAG: hypothetical protein WDO73_06645 [Ignavibacteriota bacterium]
MAVKAIFEDGRPEHKEELQLAVRGQNPRPLFHIVQGRPWMQDGGHFSPDEKWVAFSGWHEGERQRQILVVPITPDGAVPATEVVEITSDGYSNRDPVWSPTDGRIYFLSDRDGPICVWARNVDPATKQPVGDAFPRRPTFTPRHT